MPHRTISFKQSREVDRLAIDRWGISGLVLMENAGSNCARWIHHNVAPSSCAILCGKGNNGGDGYVIARHLELLGVPVKVLSACPLAELSGDALVNAKIAVRCGFAVDVFGEDATDTLAWLSGCDVIVDCLLGTGVSGSLRQPFVDLVQAANQKTNATRVAIDVPTGWPAVQDADPADQLALRANRTLTFVAAKTGMDLDRDDDPWLGKISVIGIGVPKKLLDELDIPSSV